MGLDSVPLIYFIEENPTYLEITDAFFTRVGSFGIRRIEVLILEKSDRKLGNTDAIAPHFSSVKQTSSAL